MSNKGIGYGTGAYLLWCIFPVYFKALHSVPALEIMFHRVVWCLVFLGFLIWTKKEWRSLLAEVAKPRVLLIYSLAALLLALNWLLYIYGVNSDQVVETSLGYFINPLLSVALGVVLLRERLRPAQWLPVGMAALGVIYLTAHYGHLPWIALGLATSFGLYGLMKKVAPLGAMYGLTLETALLFLPALGYLLFIEARGGGALVHAGWGITLLLALAGPVTAVPLLMFASAARSIPLYMVGILQFIAPTGQFLLGVLLYHEPFTPERLVGFSVIWAALAFYWLEGIWVNRRLVLRQA
jgi:chloramphenicol-sensitive protein RarD